MINNFSPLLKSAFLLCSGLFIFGLADNFIILISDKVSVGQFHFSRSLVACLAVLIIAYYFFSDFPDSWTFLGLFIIVFSGIYISRRENIVKNVKI